MSDRVIQIEKNVTARRKAKPRVRLRPVLPLGVGTGQVESLTGFVHRLAQHHAMRPLQFVRTVVDAFDLESKPIRYGLQGHASCSVNGTSQLAEEVARVLDVAAGRTGHRRLTLVDCQDLFGRYGRTLLRNCLAWCPRCCDEQDTEPYHRLLWAVRAVHVCPRHKIDLAQACPNCGKTQNLLRGHPVWYYCSKCGADLLVCEGQEKDDRLNDWTLWVAKDVESFIARVSGEGKKPTARGFSDRVEQIRSRIDGLGFDYKNVVGLPGYVTKDWTRGKTRPSANGLWTFAYRLQIPSADLLYGTLPLLESIGDRTGGIRGIAASQNRLGVEVIDEMRLVLENALRRPLADAPSLNSLQNETGIYFGRFTYHWPELTRKVKERKRIRDNEWRERRKRARVLEIIAAIKGLERRGIYPSDRNLKTTWGIAPSDLRRTEVIQIRQFYRKGKLRVSRREDGASEG